MSANVSGKIVFMLEDIGALGGVQRHVFDSAVQFQAFGFEVEVLSRFSPTIALDNFPPRVICLYGPGYPEIRERSAAGDSVAAEKLLSLQTGARARLNSYLKELTSSTIVIAVQYGMLYELDLGGWLDGQRPFKVIGAYHSSYDYARSSSYFKLLISLLKKVDAAVFLTEHDRLNFAGMGVTNTLTIPNAVVKPALPASILRKNHAVYLGRLDEEKGVVELVETWIQGLKKHSEMPDLHFFGTGSLEQELRARIHESGFSDSIQLKGKTAQPFESLASARVVVSCSPKEGFPMTLLEASAVGTPAVVYNAGPGTVELVDKLNTGRVVASGNRGDFIRELIELTTDEDAWAQHSDNCEEAAKFYAPETIYRKWIDLFEKLTLTGDSKAQRDSAVDDSLRFEFLIPEGHEFAGIDLLVDYKSFSERSFVALVKAIGDSGADISANALDLPRSTAFNRNFVNSPEIILDEDEPLMHFPVRMKATASRFEVSIERWGLKRHSPRESVRSVFVRTISNSMVYYIPVKLLSESEQ